MRKPKTEKQGKIIIPVGVDVWPHEQETAKVLIKYGHVVEFLKTIDKKGRQTADCLVDGVVWEMKSPRASNLKTVERNLKRGKWQSDSIIFDSRRMKHIPDKAIEKKLRVCFTAIKEIKQIKFINRRGQIIDIQ